MLKRLKVDNFKCLDGFDLELGDHALLMGLNGTGKSTVIEMLERLRRFLVDGEKARNCFPASTQTRRSSFWKKLQRFELFLEGDIEVTIELTPPDEEGIVQVVKEVVRAPAALLERQSGPTIRIGSGPDDAENIIILVPDELAALPLVGLFKSASSVIDTLLKVFSTVSDILPFRLAPTQMEVLASTPAAALAPDGANFAAWLLMFDRRFPERREAMERQVAAVLPAFRRFHLVPEGEQFRLVTEWRSASGKTGRFDFNELSDGQRLIAVLAGIAVATEAEGRASTLVLDEPDNYVALPEIQPLLLSLMDQPGMQLIVASHHPEIIDLMAKDYGIVFTREDDIGPVRVERWQAAPDEALTPSELVARGELHGGA
ncbi:MAG TPA: AAA family ATPase [Polyangia bacterium]|jgi:energy-coupling factor transporter ATP-binding protein EcfA2|nr:AAA family ATPase [Polyangia bacterium]